MQKCNNDKNKEININKNIICNGFSCKPTNDFKKIKTSSSLKLMIDINEKKGR